MGKRKWTFDEVQEYRQERRQLFFYFNPQDSNIFVPKQIGWGWTNNWAHPASWLIILAVLGLLVYNAHLGNR